MNKTIWMFPLVALLALIFASCTDRDNQVNSYSLGENFTLKVGQSLPCDCTAPIVSLTEVFDDSRCPVPAECVLEGAVSVRLDVDGTELVLTKGIIGFSEEKLTATLGDYIYTLVEVNPDPRDEKPIEQDEYEVELLIEEL